MLNLTRRNALLTAACAGAAFGLPKPVSFIEAALAQKGPEVGKGFRPLLFLFVSVRAGDGCSHLVGHEVQKSLMRRIERPPGIHSDDEPAGRYRVAGGREGHFVDRGSVRIRKRVFRVRCGGLQLAVQVRQREHDIVRVSGQRLRGYDAGLPRRSRRR